MQAAVSEKWLITITLLQDIIVVVTWTKGRWERRMGLSRACFPFDPARYWSKWSEFASNASRAEWAFGPMFPRAPAAKIRT